MADDGINLVRFILAFLLVVGMIGLMGVLLRRYGQQAGKMFGAPKSGGRLEVVETHYIDHKRKLALVKRDGVEHLLLLGEGGNVVVEAGIKDEK